MCGSVRRLPRSSRQQITPSPPPRSWTGLSTPERGLVHTGGRGHPTRTKVTTVLALLLIVPLAVLSLRGSRGAHAVFLLVALLWIWAQAEAKGRHRREGERSAPVRGASKSVPRRRGTLPDSDRKHRRGYSRHLRPSAQARAAARRSGAADRRVGVLRRAEGRRFGPTSAGGGGTSPSGALRSISMVQSVRRAARAPTAAITGEATTPKTPTVRGKTATTRSPCRTAIWRTLPSRTTARTRSMTCSPVSLMFSQTSRAMVFALPRLAGSSGSRRSGGAIKVYGPVPPNVP